jgi:hypothetical protein
MHAGKIQPEADKLPEAEMLERDSTGALVPVGRPPVRSGRAIGAALPVAVMAVALAGSLAFGAAGFRLPGTAPAAEAPVAGTVTGPADDTEQPADDDVLGRPAGDADGQPAGGPGENPAPAQGGEATTAPTDKPTAEPTAAPTLPPVATIELKAAWGDGKVRLAWTGCEPEGFAYWKVVRSRDATLTWPKGDDDVLVTASDDPAARAAKDGDAPRGKTAHYRVFALARVGDMKVVVCASDVASVAVPEATPEPTAKPKPTEDPKPDPTDDPGPSKLGLEIGLKNGYPYLAWTVCNEAGFDYYKVVASPDDTVRWPLGGNDDLRAAFGDRSQTTFKDVDAPAGEKLWYRVFCLQKADAGYVILAASAARAVTVPDGGGEPAPDPKAIGLDAVAGEGGVRLDWEACRVEGFVYYKVVRSHGSNPSYLPWTDGTELVGVISDAGVTGYEDADVASGQTWFYRVQAIGRWNDQKVVLCQTRAVEVTIP